FLRQRYRNNIDLNSCPTRRSSDLAKDIRIEAPIPGKNTIGIEIPNKTMHLVNLQEIFESNSFKDAESPLTVALGLTIEGSPIVTNIDEMPHGLIAGATGSGKS